MISRDIEVVYLYNLRDQLETLEVIYDGMVSKNIIDLIKQAKSQTQVELNRKEKEEE